MLSPNRENPKIAKKPSDGSCLIFQINSPNSKHRRRLCRSPNDGNR